jgi:hypothetical protein
MNKSCIEVGSENENLSNNLSNYFIKNNLNEPLSSSRE